MHQGAMLWPLQLMKPERQHMNDLHEYTTTHNGAIVQVYIDLTIPAYMDRLDSVWYEGVDVTPLLDLATLTALGMEAERAISGDITE